MSSRNSSKLIYGKTDALTVMETVSRATQCVDAPYLAASRTKPPPSTSTRNRNNLIQFGLDRRAAVTAAAGVPSEGRRWQAKEAVVTDNARFH